MCMYTHTHTHTHIHSLSLSNIHTQGRLALTKVQVHVVESGFAKRLPSVEVVQQCAVDPSIAKPVEQKLNTCLQMLITHNSMDKSG